MADWWFEMERRFGSGGSKGADVSKRASISWDVRGEADGLGLE